MKKLLLHITSYSLIIILLGATLQFSLYKMECLMSGNVQVSFSDFEACNKQTSDQDEVTQKCCAFHNIILDFEYNTERSTHKVMVHVPQLAFNEALPNFTSVVPQKQKVHFYTNLPPPSGIELLQLVQVFRL